MEVLDDRWEADESACWAHRRVHVYRLLSAGFGPSSPFLERLLSTTEFLGYLRQALSAAPDLFRDSLEEMEEFFRTRDAAREVWEEHRRLFPRRVSPQGSDHGGPPPRKVWAFYRDAGLAAVAPSLPPDHIAAETAFLAALAEQEMWLQRGGEEVGARAARERSLRFLGEHPGHWVPRFTLRVESESASPFYGPLARVLCRWVALDGSPVTLAGP